MARKSKTRIIYRSAITGRIIRASTAKKNPRTSIKQRVRLGRGKRI